ncbi:MAG: hypothetical protein JSS79_07185 [Bacteroidetes bacterium]|nr:hypothetical protein [Bacteroidota bacterium]
MKKISLLLSGVLLCTLMSANATPFGKGTSSVAITNVNGSTLFKLYYKAEKLGRVKISITNEQGIALFEETMYRVDGFVRPYNFESLPEGQYTIAIEDESGKTIEKVNYQAGKVEKLIHVQKLLSEDNKYLLTIASAKPEEVFIYIFDNNGNLIFNEIQSVGNEFARVYDLSNYKSFTIEVLDKQGMLKSISY